MRHLEYVTVNDVAMQRWIEAAESLGEHGTGLQLELGDIARGESTRHMCKRAANAARMAEAQLDDDLQALAASIAADLEDLAEA